MISKSNVIFVIISNILSSVSLFFSFILLGRNFTVKEFGEYSLYVNTISIMLIIFNFGTTHRLLKSISINTKFLKFITIYWGFLLVTLILFSPIFYLVIKFIIKSDLLSFNFLHLIAIISITLIIEYISVQLQATKYFIIYSINIALLNVIRLFGVLIYIYYYDASFNLFPAIITFSGVISLTISIILIFYLYKNATIKQVRRYNLFKFYLSILKSSYPFFLAALYSYIYMASDIYIIYLMLGPEYAGFYNIAFITLTGIVLVPSAIYQKYLMPIIHKLSITDTDILYILYKKSNKYLLKFGILISCLIIVFHDLYINIFWGQKFMPVSTALIIISASIPAIFLAFNSGAILVTKKLIYKKQKIMGLCAILNIILNIFLIPHFGINGAAFSTTITLFILTIFYSKTAKKYVF